MPRPARSQYLPLLLPALEEDDYAAVRAAMESGWLSTGPKVTEFEHRLASFLDGREVVTTNSGTAALHLAALVSGLGPGDEVIVPSLAFAPAASMALLVGAKPVFADVDARTLCLDVADVRRKITSRTRAVLVIHLAGRPADLRGLRALCDEHKLLLIEDAAHAFGARSGNEWIGRHGDLVCFSFHATKPLTTGEGGALVTRDPEQARVAREYRWYGVDASKRENQAPGKYFPYRVVRPGFKYVMNDPQAALGLSQLTKFLRSRDRRRAIAQRYAERLERFSELLSLPPLDVSEGEEHAWHLFIVQLQPAAEMTRDAFMDGLRQRNIASGIHYSPLHSEPLYEGTDPLALPVTELIAPRLVSLPFFTQMTDDDVDDVCDAIEQVLTSRS